VTTKARYTHPLKSRDGELGKPIVVEGHSIIGQKIGLGREAKPQPGTHSLDHPISLQG
jgi:hypothetical protein